MSVLSKGVPVKPIKRRNDFVLSEDDKSYMLEYPLPGYNKDNVEIFVPKGQSDVLKIIYKKDKMVAGEIWYKLPKNVLYENIKAEMKDGMLTVIINLNTDEEQKDYYIDID